MSDAKRKPVVVGLLGCGTVGGGVVQLLAADPVTVAARVGAPVQLRKVLVRDASKARVPELDTALLTTDPEDVLADPTI
ncbi:MAG: homoserine dehydrogenase, partial [Polyangiaceae bacterium]